MVNAAMKASVGQIEQTKYYRRILISVYRASLDVSMAKGFIQTASVDKAAATDAELRLRSLRR